MISFTCSCGYHTVDSLTVAVINEQTGECPVCGEEATAEQFAEVSS